MRVKSESEIAQRCPTLSNPMDWSLPGSSIRGIFQARVLEWGAIAFSKKEMLEIKNTVTEMKNASDKFISTLSMVKGKKLSDS